MLTFTILLVLIMHDTIITDNVNIHKIWGKDHIVYNICWYNLLWYNVFAQKTCHYEENINIRTRIKTSSLKSWLSDAWYIHG